MRIVVAGFPCINGPYGGKGGKGDGFCALDMSDIAKMVFSG